MKQTASHRIGRLLAVLVATVSLGASAACSSSSTSADGDRNDAGVLRELTIGLAQPQANYAPVYVAQALGFFKEQGIESPTIREFDSGSAMQAGIASGDIQVAAGGATSTATVAAAGRNLKLFFGIESTFPYDVYVRSTISSWDDVKGKTVAITSPGSQIDAATQLVLANHGIDSNEVQILSIGGDSARMAAMRAGQVDMTLLWEGNKYLAEGANAKPLESGAANLPFEGGAMIASGDFLAQEKATAAAIVRALMQANAAIHDPARGDEVKRALSEGVGDPNAQHIDDMYAAISKDEPGNFPVDGHISMEGVQTVLTFLAETDQRFVNLKPSDIVDTTIIDAEQPFTKSLS